MAFKIRKLHIIVAIVIIIISVYVSYYYRYPESIGILQTSLDLFTHSMLLSKQPLLIQDSIAGEAVDVLGKAWFGGNGWTPYYVPTGIWYRNRHKFLTLYAIKDTEVFIYPPWKKVINGTPQAGEGVVCIKLKQFQLVVLPLHWRVIFEDDGVACFARHDFVTAMLP